MMEFKFSCKLFEIAFSGDPGFVEIQLNKYEPYILKVLERIEEESKAEKNAPPPKVRDPDAGKPMPDIRDHPRSRQRQQHNRGPKRKEPPTGKKNTRPAPAKKSDRGGPGRRHDSRPRMDKPMPASNPGPNEFLEGNNRPDRKDISAPMPLPDALPPKAESSEFPSRRKAPGIHAEVLQKIMDAKRPRTHHDRVMVFGYYMEHEGQGSDFTVAEIKKCYRVVGQEAGMNIEQVINHATRSGFIVLFNIGRTVRFKLSNKGRRYVDDGLKLA